MKADDFKKMIRVLVQEELTRQLPILVPKILTEALSGKQPQPVIAPRTIKNPELVKKPAKPPVKYTNNPLINQILSETVCKIKPENTPFVGYSETLNSSIQNDIEVHDSTESEMVDYTELNESVVVSTPVISDVQPATDEQAKVLGKLNRDFRGLMKAIDSKKKAGFNSSNSQISFEQ